MRLATFRNGRRDGALMVVDRALTRMVFAGDAAPTMQAALDDWDRVAPHLQAISEALEAGKGRDVLPYDPRRLAAPLPRAFGWIDGTAYLSHMQRARELRGATLPEGFDSEPLMGERVSAFLGGHDDLPLMPGDVGMDIEGEIGVILDDVPIGADEAEAARHIRLLTLVNDVSLRTILADTATRGRSVTLAAKPYPALAPVAVTPDELGEAWDGRLLGLPVECAINDTPLAAPNGAVDASFGFPQLVSYCALYKPLPAGTVLAAGTVSNYDDDVGGACIAERRRIEQKRTGAPITPYLRVGDTLHIEVKDAAGSSVFGAIRQSVVGG